MCVISYKQVIIARPHSREGEPHLLMRRWQGQGHIAEEQVEWETLLQAPAIVGYGFKDQ
jgi:hypothetical protein